MVGETFYDMKHEMREWDRRKKWKRIALNLAWYTFLCTVVPAGAVLAAVAVKLAPYIFQAR